MQEQLEGGVTPPLAVDGLVTELPNLARVQDAIYGGQANFAVDRAHLDDALRLDPHITGRMRAIRAFSLRALRWCLEQGVTQFLDLGSGLPTAPSVHRTAQGLEPAARVVYVDVDPVAVELARAMTEGVEGVAVLDADLRDVDAVLASAAVADVLDLARPVAALFCGVLHWVPGDVGPVVASYRDRLASGSVVVLGQSERGPDSTRTPNSASYLASHGFHLVPRTHDEVAALFAGLEVIDPGVGRLEDWPRPRPGRDTYSVVGGVGRVRPVREP